MHEGALRRSRRCSSEPKADAGLAPGARSRGSRIRPGVSCTDEGLECPHDLATQSPACDGTTTTIATSCTCENDKWSCPDPVACDGGAAEDAGDGAAEDAASDS